MKDTKIQSYSFGKITIDRQTYTKDLIILPSGKIVGPWIRNAGHILEVADIKEILDEAPSVLVIGTGAYGGMKLKIDLSVQLQEKGINVIARPTKEAVATFNALQERSDVVAACFHLTC
jgi:hypothetical protein